MRRQRVSRFPESEHPLPLAGVEVRIGCSRFYIVRRLQPPRPIEIVAKGPWKPKSLVRRASMPVSIAPKKKSAR